MKNKDHHLATVKTVGKRVNRTFPGADTFKYLSAEVLYEQFPDMDPVISRAITIDTADAQVSVIVQRHPTPIVAQIKTADMLALVVPSDFLIENSKVHHVVYKVVGVEPNSEAWALVSYAEVPTYSPPFDAADSAAHALTPPAASSPSRADFPTEDAFKYLTKGAFYDDGQTDRQVVHRLVKMLGNNTVEVVVLFTNGTTLTGQTSREDMELYLENGDFYCEGPQWLTYVITGRKLRGNSFTFTVEHAGIPVPDA